MAAAGGGTGAEDWADGEVREREESEEEKADGVKEEENWNVDELSKGKADEVAGAAGPAVAVTGANGDERAEGKEKAGEEREAEVESTAAALSTEGVKEKPAGEAAGVRAAAALNGATAPTGAGGAAGAGLGAAAAGSGFGVSQAGHLVAACALTMAHMGHSHPGDAFCLAASSAKVVGAAGLEGGGGGGAAAGLAETAGTETPPKLNEEEVEKAEKERKLRGAAAVEEEEAAAGVEEAKFQVVSALALDEEVEVGVGKVRAAGVEKKEGAEEGAVEVEVEAKEPKEKEGAAAVVEKVKVVGIANEGTTGAALPRDTSSLGLLHSAHSDAASSFTTPQIEHSQPLPL